MGRQGHHNLPNSSNSVHWLPCISHFLFSYIWITLIRNVKKIYPKIQAPVTLRSIVLPFTKISESNPEFSFKYIFVLQPLPCAGLDCSLTSHPGLTDSHVLLCNTRWPFPQLLHKATQSVTIARVSGVLLLASIIVFYNFP
jgi:hypothetical protein